MEDEFPEVVELCVGGTHNYTTLRSTLTRDENSALAAMFTGQQPVYKNSDGKYFLDVDGPTFKTVLEYLKCGTFPRLNRTSGRSLFGFERQTSYNDDDEIKTIYRTALKLKLSQLIKFLENCFPVYVDVKLDEYRTSTPGYTESLAQVLASIPPQILLLQRQFSVRLVNDSVDIGTPRCCDHVCQYSEATSGCGGNSLKSYNVDVVVKAPVEVDCNMLSFLCYDLMERGFHVQGRETSCYFRCSKCPNAFGGFAMKNTQCCRQVLFVLHFSWQLPITAAPQPGFTFGSAQQTTTGGLFGQAQGSPSKQGFGSFSGFGQQVGSSVGFGFGQQSSGAGFGQQSSGAGFGQPSSGAGFGQQSSGAGFDQQSSETAGFGQQCFGAGFGQQETSSSGFGSGQKSQFSFGQSSSDSKGFGQSASGGLFGKAAAAGPAKTELFSSTGFGFGSSSSNTNATSSSPSKPTSVFGDAKPERLKPSLSFGSPPPQKGPSFGKSPQSSNLFGGKAVFTNPFGQATQPMTPFSGFGLVKSEVKRSDQEPEVNS